MDLKPLADASKRQELIGEWESGSFETHQEAEAEAVRLGIPPLARSADWRSFNVDELATWTIEMSIAWMLWRSYEKVTEFHVLYRERSTFWRPIQTKGKSTARNPFGDTVVVSTRYELSPLNPPSLSLVGMYARAAKIAGAAFADNLQDHNDAREKLWDALFHGRLTASGVSPISGWEAIPKRKWSMLNFGPEGKSTHLVMKDQTHKIEYANVELARSDVIELWTPIPEPIAEEMAAVGPDLLPDDNPPAVAAKPDQPKLTMMQRDIQAGIKARFTDMERPMPHSPAALQAEVNEFLKVTLGYKTSPTPESYQRYFRILRQIDNN